MKQILILILSLFLINKNIAQINYIPLNESNSLNGEHSLLLYHIQDVDTLIVKIVYIIGENKSYISLSFNANMCLENSFLILYTNGKEYLVKYVEEIKPCKIFFYTINKEISFNEINYIDILYTTKIRLLLKY